MPPFRGKNGRVQEKLIAFLICRKDTDGGGTGPLFLFGLWLI